MRKPIFVILMMLLGSLLACSLSSNASAPSAEEVNTLAAMTVQAALTQAAQGGGQPATPAPQPTQGGAPTAPPSASATPAPTLPPPTPVASFTPSPVPCNLAHFVTDVTVPDGTVFQPGKAFTKTWRLQNVGSCTWQNYSLVFDHGDQMGGPAAQPILGAVAPGQQVDISVNLTAPTAPGEYAGYWRLRDNGGVVFGLTTGNPFFVKIKVVEPTATPTPTPTPTPALPPPMMMVLDFYDQAPHASWHNGSNHPLPFPSAPNDPRGFARYADNILLEDGHKYPRVLETHPEWIFNGSIIGTYPTISVPPNAHFRAKIGFIALSNGTCGSGDVTFTLYARVGGTTYITNMWHKMCDGALRSVDVDLAAFSGQQVVFSLKVFARGSSAQDWAVWVSPVITVP